MKKTLEHVTVISFQFIKGFCSFEAKEQVSVSLVYKFKYVDVNY